MPNAMGGTHLHTPQSVFQHSMNPQTNQNEPEWFRTPQIPSMTMPWSIPSSQQPDVVRFTGNTSPNTLSMKSMVLHKRKWEAPDVVDIRPAKQLLTEEKMAQHFRGLHITPNSINAQEPGPSMATATSTQNIVESNDLDLEISDLLETNNDNSSPRLVISEELKRLQQEPLLPSSLLSKLERPSMALVLWEPPSKHLHILPSSRDSRDMPIPSSIDPADDNNNGVNSNNDSNENSSNNNNNNGSIPNLNQTMDMNFSDPVLEPMDI